MLSPQVANADVPATSDAPGASSPAPQKPVRHILSLSGGKDSSALAVYMRDRVPEMEYVFCDTSKELAETYDYLDKLEAYLGRPIIRLKQDADAFDRLLQIRRGFLPSPRMRWCTELLKIKPFEKYIGNDEVVHYVGIRADENRKGYETTKPNITARYPFKEDGIGKEDVKRILEDSGLGFPDYYQWRSRSGCYFCFFQQKIEWVGLLERHPDLYDAAQNYEKTDEETGERYTWVARESLAELRRPERVAQIKEETARRLAREHEERRRFAGKQFKANLTLAEMIADDDEDGERACLICEL
jgi:3''-phosphoadenosine 5''-phosphosulfate sulfotransferase (PAPS reductase)/FAD synthetase and related enzymes